MDSVAELVVAPAASERRIRMMLLAVLLVFVCAAVALLRREVGIYRRHQRESLSEREAEATLYPSRRRIEVSPIRPPTRD